MGAIKSSLVFDGATHLVKTRRKKFCVRLFGLNYISGNYKYMKKINESFVCINCGKEISQASKTCRNHCPYCFVSLHVDWDIPWDRKWECNAIMYPTTYKLSNSEYKILFECSKCHKKHRNKRAEDDEISLLPELIKTYQQFLQ